MKQILMPFRLFLTSCLLLVIGNNDVFAQNLLHSEAYGRQEYIYKLSYEDAKDFYINKNVEIKPEYFKTLVDSFDYGQPYNKVLKPGYYLKVKIEDNKLNTALTSVQDFEVFLLNNDTDLNIRVLDVNGNGIKNANVKLGKKKIPFDENTQSYSIRKSYKQGLLSVKVGESTVYYKLLRSEIGSKFKRKLVQALYTTPVKYVWVPINFAIDIPVSAYKSIKHGWLTGSIAKIENFAVRLYKSVACWFDNYHCESRNTYDYTVTNKPKYRLNDTLKFKAFVLNHNYKPFKKPLDLVLKKSYKDEKKIATIRPYAKGGYAYNLHLVDSFGLTLDKSYTIELKDQKGRYVASERFYFEDYTLKGNSVELSSTENTHYKGDSLQFSIKAIDENELFLMDARAEVLISPKSYGTFFEEQLFIPDSIWTYQTPLNPKEITQVTIPPDVFPKANFQYTIQTVVKTSDNEAVTQELPITYVHDSKEILFEEQNDSITFKYFENGKYITKPANLYTINHLGKTDTLTGITLPYTLKLNPSHLHYSVETDSISKTVSVENLPDNVSLTLNRTKDSISVNVNNPRKLDILYTLYKVNTEIARGNSKTIQLNIEAKNKKNYMLSLAYIWGGQTVKKNQFISLNENRLNLQVKEPLLIYPGKKDTISIRVTDYKNEPVKDVDVTAFGLTKKFNYQLPRFPWIGKDKKSKHIVNNYSFNEQVFAENRGDLDYNHWKDKANLDSIIYYNFMYPKDIFITDVKPKDTITQFAPFVMEDGLQVPIHVIYINNNPVYFDWNTHDQQYSFKIDSGYQNIKLRTHNKSYTIDSLYFKHNRKTIFSVGEHVSHPKIKVEELSQQLTATEKSQLYPRVLVYNQTQGRYQAFITSRNRYFSLDNNGRNRTYRLSNLMTGPIYERFSFKNSDSLTYTSNHESGYAYTFRNDYLKLKSYRNHILPQYFNRNSSQSSIHDQVTTLADIHKAWQEQNLAYRKKKFSIKYPRQTDKDFAKLQLDNQNDNINKNLINIIIANTKTDSIRVYPGSFRLLHQLEPENYRLILLYDDMTYQVEEDINLKPNGLNIVQIKEPELYLNDFFSQTINEIIDSYGLKTYSKTNQAHINNYIKNTYQNSSQYFGPGIFVSGNVIDQDGLPIPGVNIIVKGKSIGTTTDFDGNFSLKVPKPNAILVYSYVGFSTVEQPVKTFNTITLEYSIEQLDAVVVKSYAGILREKAGISTSVNYDALEHIPESSIEQALQGKLAGVNISRVSGNPGLPSTVIIRGRTSIEEKTEPLYIVDGVPINANQFAKISANDIKSLKVLKDAAATSIYGNKGANGVIIIDTKSKNAGIIQEGKPPTSNEFLNQSEVASSIRTNFSDVAYWQPTLRTDKNGEVQFIVTYPDDITSWQNVVLAMNGKRQSAKYQSFTKSYKPVSARLFTPKFLVEGDALKAIGKTLNYTKDTLSVETKFSVNDQLVLTKKHSSINAIIDTLPVMAKTDTLQLTYKLQQQGSDYFDGEKREIPVFKKGVELQKGIFRILQPGDSIFHQFEKASPVQFYAESNVIEVLERDVNTVIHYKYDCNEQLASKLKMLLLNKHIDSILKRDFTQEKSIKKLIKTLAKNKKKSSLWGWWKSSKTESYWISQHVIEAFLMAEDYGYKSQLEKEKVAIFIKNQFLDADNHSRKADLLFTLSLLNETPFPDQMSDIKGVVQDSTLALDVRLKYSLALQNYDIQPDISFLKDYQKETIFGNIYFEEPTPLSPFKVYQNTILNTLSAYKLIKFSNPKDDRLVNIQNYLIESKTNHRLINTYQTAQVLGEILPDVLTKNSSKAPKAMLSVNDEIISTFGYRKQYASNSFNIKNTGDFPIYVTAYQSYWETEPHQKTNDFEVNSFFKEKKTMDTENGEEVTLTVEIDITKKAEFIMLNIPIPAGFEYVSKPVNYGLEDHREYFKDRVSIFSSALDQGQYTFEIPLIARFSGKYHLNPAKIELMYFPTFHAHEGLKTVEVK